MLIYLFHLIYFAHLHTPGSLAGSYLHQPQMLCRTSEVQQKPLTVLLSGARLHTVSEGVRHALNLC